MEIKIESKTVDKGLDLVGGFLQKLINPPVEQVGNLLADNVRVWRFKNQVRLLQKAEDYIERKNISTKKIPLKVLIPLLEGASLEEDETLQDKWVALLVNYVDSKSNFQSTVFPYILTQISTIEAKGLEFIDERWEVTNWGPIHEIYKLSEVELSNLVRLGLIKEVIKIKTERGSSEFDAESIREVSVEESPTYSITELGTEFLKACRLSEIEEQSLKSDSHPKS